MHAPGPKSAPRRLVARGAPPAVPRRALRPPARGAPPPGARSAEAPGARRALPPPARGAEACGARSARLAGARSRLHGVVRRALARVMVAGTLPTGGPAAQQAPEPGPWFGLPLPPGLQPHAAPAIIGDRGPAPAIVPAGEDGYHALEGASIRRDLEKIVAFSSGRWTAPR